MSRPSRVLETSQVNSASSTIGGDDDDDLDVGQLHGEAAGALVQRVAAGNDRRHRLDPRALRDLRVVGQDERHADGREHRRQPERVPQRPVGDALDGPAIQRGDRHRHQQHDQQDQRDRGQAERDQDQERDQRDEAADHENVAMGEIDHADDAIDHGVADGDQAVDRAEHEAVDQLLGEIIHALPLLENTTRREPPAAQIDASSRFLTAGTGGGNSAGCGRNGLYRASFSARGSAVTVRTRLCRAMIPGEPLFPRNQRLSSPLTPATSNMGDPKDEQSEQSQNPGQQNQQPGQKPGQQQGGGHKPGSSSRIRAVRTPIRTASPKGCERQRKAPPKGGAFLFCAECRMTCGANKKAALSGRLDCCKYSPALLAEMLTTVFADEHGAGLAHEPVRIAVGRRSGIIHRGSGIVGVGIAAHNIRDRRSHSRSRRARRLRSRPRRCRGRNPPRRKPPPWKLPPPNRAPPDAKWAPAILAPAAEMRATAVAASKAPRHGGGSCQRDRDTSRAQNFELGHHHSSMKLLWSERTPRADVPPLSRTCPKFHATTDRSNWIPAKRERLFFQQSQSATIAAASLTAWLAAGTPQ